MARAVQCAVQLPVSVEPGVTPFSGPADAIDLSRVRRVLVIKLRHHGDVLLTSPVFAALKVARPDIQIDALVYRETLPLIAHNPHLSVVHSIDRKWKRGGLRKQVDCELGLLKALRARRYDLLVHLTEHNRGAVLSRLLRTRWSVAPYLQGANVFWKGSFTHYYRSGTALPLGSQLQHRHTVEQNLDALRRLGIAPDEALPLLLEPGAAGTRAAEEFLAANGLQARNYILMQPTSRWFFKTWPVQRNAELISRLLARGETVLLSCAPDVREQQMVDAIVAAVTRITAGAGTALQRLKRTPADLSLEQLGALIARARLFVGIDSAPMHMAAAVGTPLVALFGPSSELTWGPWQVPHRVVTHDAMPCRPCGQDGCGGSKISDCLTRLPVESVMAAIDALNVDGAGQTLPVDLPERADIAGAMQIA